MLLKNAHKDPDFSELQQLISQDSHAAFACLFKHFSKRFVSFATSLTHSRETAEDVVEDIFVKLWARRQTIATIENISVYLYVAVKNASLNKISERARQLISQPFDNIDPQIQALSDDPYSLMITNEMLGKLNKAIENLPPRCKMIFKLVREDGLRYKEVSEILNISVNTIDVQMAIAVERLCLALGIKKETYKKPLLSFKKS